MVIYVEFRFRPDGTVLYSTDYIKLQIVVNELKRKLALEKATEKLPF